MLTYQTFFWGDGIFLAVRAEPVYVLMWVWIVFGAKQRHTDAIASIDTFVAISFILPSNEQVVGYFLFN